METLVTVSYVVEFIRDGVNSVVQWLKRRDCDRHGLG